MLLPLIHVTTLQGKTISAGTITKEPEAIDLTPNVTRTKDANKMKKMTGDVKTKRKSGKGKRSVSSIAKNMMAKIGSK